MADAKYSPEAVAALIKEARFDVSILSQLEDYVRQQVRTGAYDFAANRHLLKTYAFNPDTVQINILGLVLMKSLMRLPATDYLAATYLVGQHLHAEEPVKTIFKLAALLESASYKRFWQECEQNEKSKALVDSVPGFLDAIRDFVAVTVESTYTSVPHSVARDFLNISDKAQLAAYAEARGWTSDDENKAFKVPVLEQRSAVATTEKITLEQVSKVLGVLMADG